MERKKKIAIITGAAGGIGKEFTRIFAKETLDEIWVIGRNQKNLAWLKQEYGRKIIPVCADLTNKQDLLQIKSLLTSKVIVIMQEWHVWHTQRIIVMMKPAKQLC